jgi:CHAD domain-containing protein
MDTHIDDLRVPAKRAVRLVAIESLEQAAAEVRRLEDADDDEALHDFRVALRRLRSWVRIGKPYLDESVSKRMRRRLRKLARATNASRDLEVHRAWLDAHVDALSTRERAGVDWLDDRYRKREREANDATRERITGLFSRTQKRLSRRLERYEEEVRLDEPAEPTSFGAAIAPLVEGLASELRQQLEAVRASHDQEQAHAARITGKRLRYLLDSVSDLVPVAGAVARRLGVLQDVLGALHDAHLFSSEIPMLLEEAGADHARWVRDSLGAGRSGRDTLREARRRDPIPGLVAIAELLDEDITREFSRLEDGWLHGRADDVFRALDAVVARLATENEGAGRTLHLVRTADSRESTRPSRAG